MSMLWVQTINTILIYKKVNEMPNLLKSTNCLAPMHMRGAINSKQCTTVRCWTFTTLILSAYDLQYVVNSGAVKPF